MIKNKIIYIKITFKTYLKIFYISNINLYFTEY